MRLQQVADMAWLLVAEFLVGLGARVAPVGFRVAQPGSAAFPFLSGAGHSEIFACGVRWICGPQQPGVVYDLVLTPGSILEVTTIPRASIVDGTALPVVETMYTSRPTRCTTPWMQCMLGLVSWAVGAACWSTLMEGMVAWIRPSRLSS